MGPKDKSSDAFWSRYGGLLAASIVLVASLLLVSWFVVANFERFTELEPPIQLTMVVVASVAILLAAVLILSLQAHQHDPNGERTDALGLPFGSVAAIIALVILVVFSSTSVFLFGQIRGGEGSGGYESTGLTIEMVDELPEERILHINRDSAPAQGAQQTYTVRMVADHEESTDYARTMLTIFSTLLIAIVGFYFGQGTATRGADPSKRSSNDSNGTQKHIPGGDG